MKKSLIIIGCAIAAQITANAEDMDQYLLRHRIEDQTAAIEAQTRAIKAAAEDNARRERNAQLQEDIRQLTEQLYKR